MLFTDIQEEEIRKSMRVKYVKGTGEKLRRILRSHKVVLTFYIESTLHKLLCGRKDGVASEDKNYIVSEIFCSNCETVDLGEWKCFLNLCSN